jgi:hypothetical protein
LACEVFPALLLQLKVDHALADDGAERPEVLNVAGCTTHEPLGEIGYGSLHVTEGHDVRK